MADTTALKNDIERFVREWLSLRFRGQTFTEQPVKLDTGYSHNFDAVSDDKSIVAEILSNRSRTRTGRENTGGVRKAQVDVALLNLVGEHRTRVMLFTDSDFMRLVANRAAKLGTKNIQFELCELPPELKRVVNDTLNEASKEQRAAGE